MTANTGGKEAIVSGGFQATSGGGGVVVVVVVVGGRVVVGVAVVVVGGCVVVTDGAAVVVTASLVVTADSPSPQAATTNANPVIDTKNLVRNMSALLATAALPDRAPEGVGISKHLWLRFDWSRPRRWRGRLLAEPAVPSNQSPPRLTRGFGHNRWQRRSPPRVGAAAAVVSAAMAGSNSLNWIETLEAFGVEWTAPIVVAGIDAAALADECARRGSAGIAAEGEGWALLASDALAAPPGSWMDLPGGIAGTVILRRAWKDRPGMSEAVTAAAALVAAGGRLFVADLDVDRLMTGSPVHYPYQLRFTLDPAAEEALRAATTSTADLALEVGRAGMRSATGTVVEETRAAYGEAADYWIAVRDGAWPSLSDTPAEARGVLMEDLAAELARIAPIGPIVERRPWFAATGIRA